MAQEIGGGYKKMANGKIRILALVTAKSDSIRVPRKNFKYIAYKPLYKWTIDFLQDNKSYFKAMAFSSDKIEKFDVPISFHTIQRPPELCKEDAYHRSVVVHALDYMDQYFDGFDYVMLFQPTNPFRKKMDLLKLIVMAEETEPYGSYMYYIDDNLDSEYISGYGVESGGSPMIASGNIYLYSVPYLKGETTNTSEIVTMKIPKWRGYNINTREDFYVAEALYKASMGDEHDY
jgi:CMP-N-acetylneuraminic acid synthetase